MCFMHRDASAGALEAGRVRVHFCVTLLGEHHQRAVRGSKSSYNVQISNSRCRYTGYCFRGSSFGVRNTCVPPLFALLSSTPSLVPPSPSPPTPPRRHQQFQPVVRARTRCLLALYVAIRTRVRTRMHVRVLVRTRVRTRVRTSATWTRHIYVRQSTWCARVHEYSSTTRVRTRVRTLVCTRSRSRACLCSWT